MKAIAACGVIVAAVVASRLAAEQPAPPTGFRALLHDAGVSEDKLSRFNSWDGRLTPSQSEVLSTILFRLEQLDAGQLEVEAAPSQELRADGEAGRLFSVEGTAIAAAAVDGFESAADSKQPKQLWRLAVKLRGAVDTVTVLAADMPRAWQSRRAEEPLAEPVQFRGVLVGSTAAADGSEEAPRRALLVASHIQWHPKTGVPSGVAWLVRQGFDAALLDAVRHGRPFAKPGESREPEAFYACLAAASRGDATELWRLARDAVAHQAAAWVDAASAPDASPATRAIAEQVAGRAKLGVSSVWPLFKEPQRQVGRAVLIEGLARRAVRVIASEAAPGSGPSGSFGGIDAYYEVDVFTADSQDLPVICCVARLPEGFPTGDQIREPVRIAGVFFKRWAYSRRTAATADQPALPKRLAPPLVIAAEPEWLARAGSASGTRGLWAGAALAVVLAAALFALARVSRRDRLARARRVRYDEPPDHLAEP